MRRRIALTCSLVALLVAAAVIAGTGCGSKKFTTSTSQGTSVSVFLLKGDGVFVKVSRPASKTGAETALQELLKGPSASDKQQDLSTAIPDGVKLLSYSAANGAAKVDLSKELKNHGDGSATVQAIVNQINNTVMSNDSTVKSVAITVGGVPSDEALKP